MATSLSSLMTSGTALVFRSMTQIQAMAAEMGVTNQQFMQDILSYEPDMLKCGLQISSQQANEQQALGNIQFGEALGSAAGTLLTMGAGRLFCPDAPSGSQMKVDIEEADDENSSTDNNGGTVTARNSSANQDYSANQEEEEAVVQGNQVRANKATAKTKKNAEDEQKKLMKAQSAIESKRNIVHTVFAPMVGNIGQNILKINEGQKNAAITNAQAKAQFVQGVTQMANQISGQTSANVQSKEQQEQAAAGALNTMIQMSGRA